MAKRTPIKWPRQYAAEILAEPSRAKRADMLAAAPQHLQAMVRFHVEHAFLCRRSR
jgi:hypothetical protein